VLVLIDAELTHFLFKVIWNHEERGRGERERHEKRLNKQKDEAQRGRKA